jgi:hypothetical protein
MVDFTEFEREYAELTNEITAARYQFLPDRLKDWFALLDNTPGVTSLVQQLQSGLDFSEWFKKQQENSRGRAKLVLPEAREQRLGMQLLMFRNAAAKNKPDVSLLGFHFIGVGTNVNDNAQAFIEQVFLPMARDLRRYLQTKVSALPSESESGDLAVPASDRTVKLDHNSVAYREAMDALQTLERVLKEANDYPDLEEKDQHIAEVSATSRLLQSVRVRVAAVIAVVGATLRYLVSKFVGAVVGKAASFVIEKITKLLGSIF